MKNVVVTGATGVVGMALLKELCDMGAKVYVVCRPNSARAQQITPSAQIIMVPCDISELHQLTALIPEKIDVFFHLAWKNTLGADARNDMPRQIGNIGYTMDAIRVAKALGCDTFIGAGSQAEYGRTDDALTQQTPCAPENGYGMAKLCAGQMGLVEAHKHGMRFIWTRILSVYGPYDAPTSFISTAIQKAMDAQRMPCTPCEQMWDYLYAEDAGKALLAIAKKGKDGVVYLIGQGKAMPLKEYIQVIYDKLSPNTLIGFGDVPYAAQQVMHLCADITELTQDTGFVPSVPFEEGIQKTIDWMKKTREKG